MKRTLTSRGLAVVSVGFAVLGLGIGPASAGGGHASHHHHIVIATGTWRDPGAIIDLITPTAGNTAAQVDMHGGTVARGQFTGTSTYTLSVNYDLASGVSDGTSRETYSATLGRWGSGHVTFAEHVHVAGNGDTTVVGVIVGGDGVFKGAQGFAGFIGTSVPVVADPNTQSGNPSAGPYTMWIDLAR